MSDATEYLKNYGPQAPFEAFGGNPLEKTKENGLDLAILAARTASKYSLTLFKKKFPVWKIENTFTGKSVKGQFPLEMLNKSGVGTGAVVTSSANMYKPAVQFVGADPNRFVFNAYFYSGTKFENPFLEYKKLEEWAEIDLRTHTKPLCYFYWGPIIEAVYIEKIVNIQYGPLVANRIGMMRWVSADVNLIAKTTFPYEDRMVTDAQRRDRTQGKTLYYIKKKYDSYESIATDLYSDPMLGVTLRQNNRTNCYPSIGTVIEAPKDSSDDLKQQIAPKSIVLQKVYNEPQFLISRAEARL